MSTPTPAVAPYVPTYANRSVYLTSAEYEAAPTGVPVTQLVPGQSPSQSAAILARTIGRASSWADQLCKQVLAATLDTQAGIYRAKADGSIIVPCDYSPIILVTNVSIGDTPSKLTPLSDLTDVWPMRKTVTIPGTHTAARYSDDKYVTVTYVNGYANSTLLTGAAIGANSLNIASPLGVVPGLPMRLDDGQNPVTVTVDTSYVIGSSTVPITSPLVYAYAGGTSCSALPEAIKQAVISLTSALIKTRGNQAISFAAMSTPTAAELTQAGGIEDFNVALDLLDDFIRII